MKIYLTIILSMVIAAAANASVNDTLRITPENINVKDLRMGDYNYALYYRKNKTSPASRMALVNIQVSHYTYHGKPVIAVKQQWDRDTIYHSAYSLFSVNNFSTIVHEFSWKVLGYSVKYDFDTKKVDFKNITLKNGIPDSLIRKATEEFNQSFGIYNLNWHEDLLIYTMLPYKNKRTFIINYYDPGFGNPKEVSYSVTGAEQLLDSKGEKVDCWVLENTEKQDYEKFWISKKTKEVLKEEDFAKKTGFRFKVKLAVYG